MPLSPTGSGSLRIAMFVGVFPAISETFIVRQIRALIGSGHQVDIFADLRGSDGPVDKETAALVERVTYMDMPPEAAPFEMPVWPLGGRTWPPGAAKPIFNMARVARAWPKFARCFRASPRLAVRMVNKGEYGYRARSLSQVYRMARLLEKRGRYDVLHAHFGPVAESFRFARELWRAPLVTTFHGYDFTSVPRKEGKEVYKNVFATADAITGNSGFTVGRLRELGCPETKLRRLPMGLDMARFPFQKRVLRPGGTVRILVVARLTAIKGVEFAIGAVCKLRMSYPNVQLDIVGDGALRGKLEEVARRMNVKSVVNFHGALSEEAVAPLREAAHIFLHLSVTVDGDQEGQGVVLQEAQAAGLPVVATRHGAFPEGVLEGKSALLVPEGDAPAAADALLFLIQNRDVWPEMGRAGRAFVEANYDIRRLNKELIALYHDVIGRFPRA
jgi:colanic acid/amylovoran biosynthesis glycosyltransferase